MNKIFQTNLRTFFIGLLVFAAFLFVGTWFFGRGSSPVMFATKSAGASVSAINGAPEGMVFIPAGEFRMGSPPNQGDEDEHPQHLVHLDAYFIDKYEVTNAQYKQFIDSGGYENPAYWSKAGWDFIQSHNITQPALWDDLTFGIAYPDNPVVGVSWYEAEAFAKWAGKRLPTEAEWEKAARGTDGRIWPWGNDWSPERELQGETPPNNGANPYGVYNMAGSVWEWVWDWFEPNYYRHKPKLDLKIPTSADHFFCEPGLVGGLNLWRNPTGPVSGIYWTIRGGSAGFNLYETRTADRATYFGSNSCYIGFRCAKDAIGIP